jgi:protein-disulfide isomerase
MRRYLPFVIIAVVGLVTAGLATTLYRSKMHPAAQPSAAGVAPMPTVANEPEDPSLHVRGPRSAPVTIEVYGDFQCPSCGAATAVIGELEKQYTGQLRVIFHEFPLAMHNHATEAAMAAEAAGLQGHFWEMHDMIYKYQSVWSQATNVSHFFAAYAESLGLDVGQFQSDAKSAEIQERVVSEGEAGVARGVKNTPTIFINGREVFSAFRRENLLQAIDAALAEKKKS